MACDPTTITSAIIASPVSMLGNTIKDWIKDCWYLEEYVEEARRDHRLYTPVLQNPADPFFEKTQEHLQSLEHQLADSSESPSFWGLDLCLRRAIRAHKIQDRRTRLRDSIVPNGVMHLISRAENDSESMGRLVHMIEKMSTQMSHPPTVHIMHRYSIPRVHLETSDYAVGMANRIQRLGSLLLDETGPQLIGLFGMAGVGKSYLAAIVCNRHRVKEHFRDKIFWVDVSNVGCHGEVLQLQMELFSAFTGHTLTRSFASDVEGRQALCDYLAQRQERYLLVYDNVWKRSIVEPLHFELNSSDRRTNIKTLALSRRGDLFQNSRFNTSSVEVPPLSREDAYRLFCKHAFHGNEAVPDDVVWYVLNLVDRCSGIPMVVQVMAKYVSRDEQRMQRVGFWKYVVSEVGRAEAESQDDYQKFLRMMMLCYEDLKKDVKQLFLLFYATSNIVLRYEAYDYTEEELYYRWLALQVGTEADEVMRISYERAVDALKAGFLVGVDLLHLPQLIKDLGHRIVTADKSLGFFVDRCPQSQEELESAELIRFISTRCYGSVQGLESATRLKVMDQRDYSYQFNFPSSLRFLSCINISDAEEDCLSRLVELRYLRLENLGGDGMEQVLMSLRKLSKLEFLHLEFIVKVELDLSFLGCMPGLEFLHVKATTTTTELFRSCRESTVRNLHHAQLKHLKRLYIPITCTNLENRDFEQNNSLEIFSIGSGSSKEETRVSEVDRLLGSLSGPCSKLEKLHLRDIIITKLPSEFNFPNLKDLKLTVAMERFGCSSVSLPRLTILKLDGCGLLTEMPFTSCPALRDLLLTGLPGLVEIGDEFPSVTRMKISHCEKLHKLRLPGSIEGVTLEALPSLVKVGCMTGLPGSLGTMKIVNCEKLAMLPSSQVRNLGLEALPSLVDIGTALALRDLKIVNCERLAVLPSPLSALWRLTLDALPSLVEFGSEAKYPSLMRLTVSRCEKLRNILHPMRSLKLLELRNLPALVQIEAEFPSLRDLSISKCERLAGLPSLPSLEHLSVEPLPSWARTVFTAKFPRLKDLTISTPDNLPTIDQPSHCGLQLLEEFAPEVEFPGAEAMSIYQRGW